MRLDPLRAALSPSPAVHDPLLRGTGRSSALSAGRQRNDLASRAAHGSSHHWRRRAGRLALALRLALRRSPSGAGRFPDGAGREDTDLSVSWPLSGDRQHPGRAADLVASVQDRRPTGPLQPKGLCDPDRQWPVWLRPGPKPDLVSLRGPGWWTCGRDQPPEPARHPRIWPAPSSHLVGLALSHRPGTGRAQHPSLPRSTGRSSAGSMWRLVLVLRSVCRHGFWRVRPGPALATQGAHGPDAEASAVAWSPGAQRLCGRWILLPALRTGREWSQRRGRPKATRAELFPSFPSYDTIADVPLRPSNYEENVLSSLNRTIASSWTMDGLFNPATCAPGQSCSSSAA